MNILCIGQSNMGGPGLAEPPTTRANGTIYIFRDGAYELCTEPSSIYDYSPVTAIGNSLSYLTGNSVYLINAARPGTGLHSGSVRLWNMRGTGSLYQDSLDLVTNAETVPDAIMMFQGENDFTGGTSEADYLADLYTLVSDYRTEYSNPNLIFIVAKLGTVGGVPATAILNAQETFGTDANTYNRRIDGLDSLPMQDDAHYTTASLEVIGNKFGLRYYSYADGATRTWSGAADSDMNNSANYSGSGALLPHDDLVFDSGAVAATLSADLEVSSITTTSGYSGAMALGGFTLSAHAGDITFDGTGTLNLTGGLTLGGIIVTLHLGSGVGTITSTACDLIVNAGGLSIMETDKSQVFKTLTVGGGNVAFRFTGTSRAVFSNSTAPLTALNGGEIVSNQTGGAITFTRTTAGEISDSSGLEVSGASAISYIAGGAGEYTVNEINYTGSKEVTLSPSTDGCVMTITGAMEVAAAAKLRILASYDFTCVINGITCGTFVAGTVSGKTITINHNGLHSIVLFDMDTYNAGTIVNNLQASRIELSGNWVNESGNTVNPGTSLLVFKTAASVTSAGETFNAVVVDAAGATVTCADALTAKYITEVSGSLSGTHTETEADKYGEVTVSPSRGYAGTPITITCVGYNMYDTMVVKETDESGTEFGNITVTDYGTLTASIPAGFVGPAIYISNPDAETTTVTGKFTVLASPGGGGLNLSMGLMV